VLQGGEERCCSMCDYSAMMCNALYCAFDMHYTARSAETELRYIVYTR
jgi:hypothetical protein